MNNGLEMIWAMEHLLNEMRRKENAERENALFQVVRQYLGEYGFANASSENTAAAVQTVSRLRTAQDHDVMYTLQVLSQLFPKLNELNPLEAEKVVNNLVLQVKEVSSKTFRARTRISTLNTILRTAEPGFIENESSQGLSSADLENLVGLRARLHEAEIQEQESYQAWCVSALNLFLEYRNAVDRSRESKQYFNNVDTNRRMYQRNWTEWVGQESLFGELVEVIQSGQARRFGERRLAAESSRTLRLSRRLSDMQDSVSSRLADWNQALEPKVSESLEILIATNGFGLSSSKKVWKSLPTESTEVRDWIQGVLTIWGPLTVADGFAVTCSYKGPKGSSEISFTAMNSQEASSKVIQFMKIAVL